MPFLVHPQYILKVQKQILFDALNKRELKRISELQDSLIASLKVDVSLLRQTIVSYETLNNDYTGQISLLKTINFKDQNEIIILNQDKKRLKRQNFWLKVLIPVAVGATIFLDH